MRDPSHMEQVERWAKYVRDNSDWKKQHTEFINAVYGKAKDAIEKIAKQKDGREKLIKLYNVKNVKGYEKLLGRW